MAWRFKVSKYKNAAPKIPRKEEWISEIPVGSLVASSGNYIKASCSYIAFNVDSAGGGNLGILPLTDSGRKANNIPVLNAHTDFVTDFDFSPFDDYLLATGSQDNTVKVWLLPEDSSFTSFSTASLCLSPDEKRIENVLWNPVADGVLAVSTHKTVKIYDVVNKAAKFVLDGHGDVVQNISWSGNGSSLTTSCKDKKLRIFDPRTSTKAAQETKGHQNIKDSRVLWMGNKDIIMSTGFNQMRSRCIGLWDCRKFTSSLSTVSLDTSTGILMPFYDQDTDMIFIVGKGDTNVKFIELTEKSPYLTDGTSENVEQVKGAAIVPKRAMDVMKGEVNRLLLLVQNAIIPTPYIVPRKSYRDYHDDLFPDTASGQPALSASQWFSGENGEVSKISLNPSGHHKSFSRRGALFGAKTDTPQKTQTDIRGSGDSNILQKSNVEMTESKLNDKGTEEISHTQNGTRTSIEKDCKKKSSEENSRSSLSDKDTNVDEQVERLSVEENTSHKEASPVPQRVVKKFTGIRQSKFRHLEGKCLHRSLHIENIRNLCKTVPGESNMFCANRQRCAIPIEGAGGLISVLELDKPGKLPDTDIPYLQHGSKVQDFLWDPFDDCRLVVACDNAKIHIWQLPEVGLFSTLVNSDGVLKGHTEKIYFVVYHPLAKDVLVSGSYDLTVRIWDLTDGQEKIQLQGHTDAPFCFAWSPDGNQCATVCKDGKIRIYEPRTSPHPLKEGAGPEGSRGARVVWVLNGQYLFVTGFNKMSTRQLLLYRVEDLTSPVSVVDMDVTPSILVPFYDEDSSTVFLTGRGDGLISMYEVINDEPFLFPLTVFKPGSLIQGVSFLPKCVCDVRKVEFARAWMLTMTAVEPVSFAVPRVKMEYFQDDLFPDTKVTWEPVMTSTEWFSGVSRQQRKISLRPSDMKLLSEAPVEAPKPKKFESYNPDTYKTDEQKKEELIEAIDKKLDHSDKPLPQDLAEGVDDDEWDD